MSDNSDSFNLPVIVSAESMHSYFSPCSFLWLFNNSNLNYGTGIISFLLRRCDASFSVDLRSLSRLMNLQ